MGELLGGNARSTYNFDLLLETRNLEDQFPSYAPGGTRMTWRMLDSHLKRVENIIRVL